MDGIVYMRKRRKKRRRSSRRKRRWKIDERKIFMGEEKR